MMKVSGANTGISEYLWQDTPSFQCRCVFNCEFYKLLGECQQLPQHTMALHETANVIEQFA